LKQIGKRKKLGICDNYHDTIGRIRGKNLKISCPEDKGLPWVSVDGETMHDVQNYVYIETLPRELEYIFDVENYFKQYKTFI
jgi:hypothetical protein